MNEIKMRAKDIGVKIQQLSHKPQLHPCKGGWGSEWEYEEMGVVSQNRQL